MIILDILVYTYRFRLKSKCLGPIVLVGTCLLVCVFCSPLTAHSGTLMSRIMLSSTSTIIFLTPLVPFYFLLLFFLLSGSGLISLLCFSLISHLPTSMIVLHLIITSTPSPLHYYLLCVFGCLFFVLRPHKCDKLSARNVSFVFLRICPEHYSY